MEKSVSYTAHKIFREILFSKHIWNVWAYVLGNMYCSSHPIWKVKTQKYVETTGKFSYDCLRYVDAATGKAKPIHFDLGWHKIERISTIGIEAVNLNYDYKYDYKLERTIIEKICQLADEGHDIVANKEVVLEKNHGAELLMRIDLEAPSYSWMDEHAPF